MVKILITGFGFTTVKHQSAEEEGTAHEHNILFFVLKKIHVIRCGSKYKKNKKITIRDKFKYIFLK